MNEHYQSLYQVYAYPGFTEAERQQVFEQHEKVFFAKGELLLKEGRRPNEYYILESGLIRAFVHDYVGNDITTNFSTEGEVVVEVASLFQRTASRENIEALTDCVCWEISFDRFQALFHSIKSFSEWGRAWMSGKLFEFKQRSVEMITDRAKDRYLRLMEEKPSVFRNAPLKTIATYLGITDSSLSRIRKEVAEKAKT